MVPPGLRQPLLQAGGELPQQAEEAPGELQTHPGLLRKFGGALSAEQSVLVGEDQERAENQPCVRLAGSQR